MVKISVRGDVIGLIMSPAIADIFLLTLIISPGKRIGYYQMKVLLFF